MSPTSVETFVGAAKNRGALLATLHLGPSDHGGEGIRKVACVVQPLWPWPCPAEVKRNRWRDDAWACVVQQVGRPGTWALFYLAPEEVLDAEIEPTEYAPVDLRIALDVGPRSREVIEAIALCIRFQIRCHFEYADPKTSGREGRSATPYGVAGGLLFSRDHGRNGDIRAFNFERVHELRLDSMHQAEGPVWDAAVGDYILTAVGAKLP